MSHRNQRGFTMVELLVAAVVLSVLATAIATFFWSSFTSFFTIQETEISMSEKTRVLQRMSQVIRSGTKISEASPASFTLYAYFSPQDERLSQVRYFYDATAKTLSVQRIMATGTAPNYTYPPASAETTVLLRNVSFISTVFVYRDANGSNGPFTSETFKDIKGVTIDLSTAGSKYRSATQLKTNIELRNRKTNL